MPTHLIFEGAELSGKSFLMSQIYPVLESRDSLSPDFLDGCAWINSDIGVFGTGPGPALVKKYVDIASLLRHRSVMFEKLHISDSVYRLQSGQPAPDYSAVEQKLAELGFRVVLTVFDEQSDLIHSRLADRLRLYPHYRKLARQPDYYFRQQSLYCQQIAASALPWMEIKLRRFDRQEIKPVLEWIGGDYAGV